MPDRMKTKAFLLPEELWWGSWILAGVGVLVSGVVAKHFGWNSGVMAGGALLGALPALALSALRSRGKVAFMYGARPPRTHELVFPDQAQAGPLRRHVELHAPPAADEVRDYHVFAAVSVVLLCLSPAVPFLYEFAASDRSGPLPPLTCVFAGALFGAGALALFLRRLNSDR